MEKSARLPDCVYAGPADQGVFLQRGPILHEPRLSWVPVSQPAPSGSRIRASLGRLGMTMREQ